MTSPLSSPITTYGDFSINRVYDAPPAEVWAAWSDPAKRAIWFVGPDGWSALERSVDLRVGGAETLRGRVVATGADTLFSARYHVVEPAARVVYTCDMHVAGRHHSVSIATLEFIGDPEGTRLRFTEQLAFVDATDGRSGAIARKRATSAQLERLAAVL